MKKLIALTLILLGIAWLLPAYFTIQTSFLGTFTSPLNLWGRAHLRNWQSMPWGILGRWSFNTLIVCSAAAVLSPLVCVSAGYALVRYDFPGKETIFYLFLLAIAMPGILLFLPRYLLVARLNLTDSYAGLLLPGIMLPASVFLARQYLAQLSMEVIEAARLDGASEIRILRTIVFPLAVPLIILNVIGGFATVYGDFMWQYLVGRNIKTLTVGVGLFLLSTDAGAGAGIAPLGLPPGVSMESLRATASVLQSIPLIILFIISQKYFIKGLKI